MESGRILITMKNRLLIIVVNPAKEEDKGTWIIRVADASTLSLIHI